MIDKPIICECAGACPDGGGAELAGRKRKWDRLEEERGRWVRQANWMARVTGKSLVRKGQFLTD